MSLLQPVNEVSNTGSGLTSMFGEASMLSWLKTQVRIVEAWREELARQPSIDMEAVVRIERHYQWLTAEVGRLDPAS